MSGQARDNLVPPVGIHQPETSGTPQHGRTTRSLRTHGSPHRSRNTSAECRSPPPCHRSKTRSGQGYARLRPPPTNSPAGNLCSKRGRRTHHYIGTPSVHSPLSHRTQRDGTPRRLCTCLLRKQHLPPDRLLPSPSKRSHPCHYRP